MKIVFVNDMVYRYARRDPGAVGGSERYQWLLARALAAFGWATVVGVRRGLDAGARNRIDGVDFVGIGRGQFFVALYSFLAAERPDWCFWFGSTHQLGPAVAIAGLTGARSGFSAQFDLDVLPRQALTERRRFWPLYALGLEGSRSLFLQHQGQFAQLARRWQPKAHVVPGVVEVPDSFEPHATRDPYVAWVGVLRQPKRPDILVDIARRCPNVRFKVCGGVSAHRSPPGYGERYAAELAKLPNVEYLGHVAPEIAIEVISHAALLLSTSEAEGFPSVFVEAWAHGTPVVSLQVDPDHVIRRFGLGFVPESATTAPGEIERFINAPEERQAAALRSRDYVQQTHSASAVAARVDQLLRGTSVSVMQPVGAPR